MGVLYIKADMSAHSISAWMLRAWQVWISVVSSHILTYLQILVAGVLGFGLVFLQIFSFHKSFPYNLYFLLPSS